MCGIVSYIGGKNAADVLLEGLKSLEYRGYDSAGIAVMKDDGIFVLKEKGRLSNLAAMAEKTGVYSNAGIGHTRWATHGAPSVQNAHPHLNGAGDIAVVHNGIIENYEALKKELMQLGYEFVSETDSEVIPQLIDYYYDGNLKNAVAKCISRLRGSFALCVLSAREPHSIVAARRKSPLVIGVSENENFVASDIPAVLSYTGDFLLPDDDEIAVLKADSVKIFGKDGRGISKKTYRANYTAESADKGDYPHFMLKEIYEQPFALSETLSEDTAKCAGFFKGLKKVYIAACGTAYHAALMMKKVFEELAFLPAEVDLASEFRSRTPIFTNETGVIVITQSGETADTLAVLRMAKRKGVKTLAVTNVFKSSAAREADFVFYTHAGPEIAVASTKAYTSQLLAGIMLSIEAQKSSGDKMSALCAETAEKIKSLPSFVSEALKSEEKIKSLAEKIKGEDDVYFLGRGADYVTALEASLKLKEISYIHADAYAGGEIKHGPIALIDKNTPVISIMTDEKLFEKSKSNMREVAARGAYTAVVGIEEDGADFVLPLQKLPPILAPVAAIIPLQLLAYHVALLRGCDVDKPRNLAKSVTVE